MKTALALLLFTAVAHADVKLANGLHVIVAPDPTVNSIVVYVRYGGGFAEDDRTIVLDQLFADAAHDDRLDAIGGYTVSNYEAHHTDVFEVVPSGALELALWFEAKRMARFDITKAQLDAAKTAVLADYRAAYEGDAPYAALDLAIEQMLWPARGDRRGTPKQIEAATLEQLRALADARLVPANATLVIAGRVDARSALMMVRRYFDGIRAGELATVLWEDRVAPKRTSSTVTGIEAKTVIALSTHEWGLALPLVFEQLLERRGFDVDVSTTDELRITGEAPKLDLDAYLAVVQASDEEVAVARRAAKAKLLLKLESLPYRAALLANDVDIDGARAGIDRISVDDAPEMAESLHNWVVVQVRAP